MAGRNAHVSTANLDAGTLLIVYADVKINRERRKWYFHNGRVQTSYG